MTKRTAGAFFSLLLTVTLHAQTTLYDFESPAEPSSSLVDGGDGYYYGTTARGGGAGKGEIFKVDLSTGERTTFVTFNGPNGANPYGDVVFKGPFLYGTTYRGGTNDAGTVYKVDRSSGALTTITSFTGPNGGFPHAGLVVFGPDLYGTAATGGPAAAGGFGGTIFKVDPSTDFLTTVAAFGPMSQTLTDTPFSSLLVYGSYIYGVTRHSPGGFGKAFKFEPATGGLKILGFVPGDGYAGLIAVGPYLYGTTTFGCNGPGCVFRIDTATDSIVTITSLRRTIDGASPVAGLASDGSYLYGTAEEGGADGLGTVFRVDLSNYSLTTTLASFNFDNGAKPRAALLVKNGSLYGTTSGGGPNNGGVLFKLDLSTRELKTISAFNDADTGATPSSPLNIHDGFLYGTTYEGGHRGLGALYRMDLSNGKAGTVGSFNADTGGNPTGGVVALDGMLYGTTQTNGKNKSDKLTDGTVYRANPSTGQISMVTAFDQSDNTGVIPRAGLTVVGSTLYGQNSTGGGAPTRGTLFRLDPVTGAVKVVFRFIPAFQNGETPQGRFLLHGSYLYGTAYEGGALGLGSVFRFDPANETFLTLAFITGVGHSRSGLTACGSFLYGTTEGSVYKINPDTGVLTTVATLGTAGDPYPIGMSDLASDGSSVFGTTTRGGAYGHGSVFRIDAETGRLTTLASFTVSNGDAPMGGLLVDGGYVYGTTRFGGAKGGGTIFRIAIPKPRRRSAPGR